MAVCQIDVEYMQQLVDAVHDAIGKLVDAAETIHHQVDGVSLSVPGLDRFRWSGDAIAQLDDIRVELRARLDQARQIAATHSGIPILLVDQNGFRYWDYQVVFDDTPISQGDAARVAGLLSAYQGGDIPSDVVSLLMTGVWDDQFTTALVGLIPPAELTRVLDVMDVEWSNRLSPGTNPAGVDAFQTAYSQVLDGFGRMYSQAADLVTGPARVGYLDQWQGLFADHAPPDADAALAALVVARGWWPADFLTGMATGIGLAETGVGFWQTGWGPGGVTRTVVDPGRTWATASDPMGISRWFSGQLRLIKPRRDGSRGATVTAPSYS